jgi:2-methylisocitrate lyase-like PEP mutase family enzyme
LRAYEDVAGVDWVQFESPHSVEEIQQARARVSGPLSFMRGKLPRYLSLEEHQALGVFIAWYPAFTHEVMYAALWDFMQDFQARGLAAWEAFQASRHGRPYPHPLRLDVGETVAKQRELEERYYTSNMLEKYQRSPGGRRASS